MRRPSLIQQSGPFTCESLVNGHILVKPAWSEYARVWSLEEGGGPGIFTRIELARALQGWLNAPYLPQALWTGLERIAEHDRNLAEADRPHDARGCPICQAIPQEKEETP